MKLKFLFLMIVLTFSSYSLAANRTFTKDITLTVGQSFVIDLLNDFQGINTSTSAAYPSEIINLNNDEFYVATSQPTVFSHTKCGNIYGVSVTANNSISSETVDLNFGSGKSNYYTFELTALKAGKYNIQLGIATGLSKYGSSYDKWYFEYEITVLEVTSVILPSTVSLTLGENYTFTPTILQQGATCQLYWDSSDPSVATISDEGTVTTHSCGSTTITCYTNNGLSATCNLVVNPVLASNIVITPSEYTLCKGEELQLSATISPQNATSKQLTWSSSNRNIAEVDEDGHVTAYGEGNCTITARTTDGSGVKGTCTLHVMKLNKLSLRDMKMPRGALVRLPIYMDNEDAITAIQFELSLPDGVTITDYSLSSRKADQSLSVSQASNGNYLFTAFSSSSSAFSGNSGILLNLTINVSDNASLGNYSMHLSNVVMTSPDAIAYSQPDITANISVEEALIGDVNCDGKVDVTDAVAIVNYIHQAPTSNFNERAADVNGDSRISITDAVAIINIIHGNIAVNSTVFDENTPSE